MIHFISLWTSTRLHYLMMYNNYLRLQGQLQLFIWHVEWILRRFIVTLAWNFLGIGFCAGNVGRTVNKWQLSVNTGFCFCTVSCSSACRIDVVAKFCNTNWLVEQNDTVQREISQGGAFVAGDEEVGVALLTYPVLMASDILLYQSDFVPVGEDQKQHLELTRNLAERINNLYGGRKWKKLGGRGGAIFKVPEPLIPPAGARIMSLTDGLSKMSKSAPSDQSRINILDPKDLIENKIKRCKTDSLPGLEFDNPERPECTNLLSIYQLISGKTKEEVMQECQNMNWGTFKPLLTDALINHLHPIQVRYEEIMSDSGYLDEVLAEGARNAADIADATLHNVYQAMGFLRRR